LRLLHLQPAPPRAGEAWTTFIGAVADLRHSNWPADLERARLWYEPHLDRIHEDAETRRADLIQLEQIASGYPSRERFLTELTLDPPDATSDQAGVPLLDEDYLILSTIHSAKGQEWKSVFVLNAVDGCMPSDLGIGTSAELEEERRLLYVAMTRAKDDLHLIVPQRVFHARSTCTRRPAHLCVKDPFHSRLFAWPVREDGLADGDSRCNGSTGEPGASHRRRRPNAWHVAVMPWRILTPFLEVGLGATSKVVGLVYVRFGAHSGLKWDMGLSPKSAHDRTFPESPSRRVQAGCQSGRGDALGAAGRILQLVVD